MLKNVAILAMAAGLTGCAGVNNNCLIGTTLVGAGTGAAIAAVGCGAVASGAAIGAGAGLLAGSLFCKEKSVAAAPVYQTEMPYVAPPMRAQLEK
jgi:hypothetical protein